MTPYQQGYEDGMAYMPGEPQNSVDLEQYDAKEKDEYYTGWCIGYDTIIEEEDGVVIVSEA